MGIVVIIVRLTGKVIDIQKCSSLNLKMPSINDTVLIDLCF